MITARQNLKSNPVVIVAGGGGFIGSFLCEALLSQGCLVVCYDHSFGKENLKTCLKSPNFVLVEKNFDQIFLQEFSRDNLYLFDFTKSSEILNKLVILANRNNSRIIAVRNSRDKLQDNDYSNLHYYLIDEVYGPRMDLGADSQVSNLIKKSITGTAPAMAGPKNYLPFFVSDVVYGLIKTMFGTMGEKVIRAGNPKVSFSEGIAETLKYFQKNKKFSQKKIKKSRLGSPVIFITCLFLAVFSPFISLVLSFRLGISCLKNSKQEIMVGNFKQAEENARLSRAIFNHGMNFSSGLQNVLDLVNLGEPAGKFKQFFNLAVQSAEVMEIGSGLGQEGKQLFARVIQNRQLTADNQNQALGDLTSSMKNKLDQLSLKLALIESDINGNQAVRQLLRYSQTGNLIDELTRNMPYIKKIIYQAKKGITLLPILIGIDRPKTYLVLLQNSAELRPTGGFIGSYAIITFSEGKLADLEVKNVYEADGQLKGHVEPPPALKKYLDIANWYLRDVNWSPDFPAMAQKAVWFLEKETGQSADGVIGINLFMARQLLAVFDGIKLTDYQETITADNLFEKAEYYAENNYFSGSTQKEDFLGGLAGALFEKIKTADENKLFKLGQAVWESFQSKDILVSVNDLEAFNILADLNWDGRIRETNIQASANGYPDYLMIIEANVGVNKANYYVKRKVNHTVKIGLSGEVSEVLKIVYKNESLSEKFPAGSYKNYLRILTPGGTRLDTVKIDGQLVDRKDINEETIAQKSAFGVLVTVPVQQETTIEFSYTLDSRIVLDRETAYLLYFQKQSGIEDDQVKIEFILPPEVFVLSVNPPAVFLGQKYQFSRKFDQDLIFELMLKK
jgi:hypothetical protein